MKIDVLTNDKKCAQYAEATVKAILKSAGNKNYDTFKGNTTITFSTTKNQEAFALFDYEKFKCGDVGRRNVVKDISIALLGYKVNVVETVKYIEDIYNSLSQDHKKTEEVNVKAAVNKTLVK